MKLVVMKNLKLVSLILALGLGISFNASAQYLNNFAFQRSFDPYTQISFGNPQNTDSESGYKLSLEDSSYGHEVLLPEAFEEGKEFKLKYDIFGKNADGSTSYDFFSAFNAKPQFMSNYFATDYLKVKSSTAACPGECRKDYYNCGWGPITEEKFQENLKACGMTDISSYNQPVFYSSNDEKISLKCAIDGVVSPVETSLNSLAGLLKFDCSNMKPLGDGPYCHCILNKAKDSTNKYFSPLAKRDVASIEQMIQLSHYQKEIRALKNSFSRVSEILSVAIFKDPKLKEILENNPKGKACLPGSFNQVEAFLSAKGKDGKSTCGDGLEAMNRITRVNEAEDLCSGSDTSNCPPEYKKENGELDIDSIFKASTASIAGGVGGIGHVIGRSNALSFLGKVEDETIRMAQEHLGVEAAQQLTTSGLNILQLNKGCDDASAAQKLTAEHNARCNHLVVQDPPSPYSYSTNIAMLLKDYRKKEYSSPTEFINSMSSKGKANLSNLMRDIGDNYSIIQLGILENPLKKGSSPEGMLIQLLSDIMPENANEKGGADDVKFANEALNALNKIETDLVKSAAQNCDDFLEKTIKICKELSPKKDPAKKNKKGLAVGDLKNFNPEDVLKFANSDTLGGSLYSETPTGLNKKMNQYRCAKIVSNKDLSDASFEKRESRSGGPIVGAMDIVRLDLNEESSDEETSVSENNPFTSSPGKIQTVAESSNNPGLNQIVKDIKGSTSSGHLAVASGTGSSVNEEFTELEGTSTAMDTISNAASSSFADSAASSQNTQTNKSDDKTYASSLNNYNEAQLSKEEAKIEGEKSAADSRLDEISKRLADLMDSRDKKDKEIDEKGKNLTEDQKKSDSSYNQLEMQKLALQKEIERLSEDKKEKLDAKNGFEQKLAEIEKTKAAKSLAKQASTRSAFSSANKSKSSKSVGAKSGTSSASIASNRGGGGTSSGGASAASSTESSGGGSYANSDSSGYMITLDQDQLTAAKQSFQVVENLSKWVPGGKPPALRIGNILYEVELRDGKIVYENGKPKMKRPLNVSSNIAGVGLIDPKTIKEVEGASTGRAPASMRQRFSLDILNSAMDKGTSQSQK